MAYLMYDEKNADCLKITEYLLEKNIAFTKVPCNGLPEPQLVIGTTAYVGLRRIKSGIEIKLEKGKLGK